MVSDLDFETDSPISLSIYGFGGLKAINDSKITWKSYFRYYNGLIPKTISFIAYILINIRRLEERMIPKEANCSLNLNLNDYLEYDCIIELDNGITFPEIEKIIIEPFFTFDGRYSKNIEYIDDNILEIYKKPDKIFLIFDSGIIDLDTKEKTFYINKLKIDENELDDEKITGEYIFSFFNEHISKNKDENVSCTLTNNKDGKTYDLKCNPNVPFITHINNGIGIGSTDDNKNITIALEIENDYLQFENSNLTNVTDGTSSTNGTANTNGTSGTNETSEINENTDSSVNTTTRPIIKNITSLPLSLYGFGGFKSLENNTNEIIWNTYFRYYSGPKPKIINYPIILTINIRRLEEKIIMKISNCSLFSDLNDYLQYNCKSQLDEGITLSNIKKISIQPEYTFDGEYVGYLESIDQENAEPIILFDQEEVQSTIFLSFDSGTINIVKNEDKFYINNLILLFSTNNNKNNLRDLNDDITGNYKFLFYNENINKNKSENVSCILSRNKDGETYDLECKPSTPFTAHINNSTGYGDDESNKNNIVNLNVENDYVELDKDANLYYSYSKKSSNGLSKGALAGIIIACVVALIAIIVVFIIVRKNYKSQIAIPQESQNDIMQKNLS